ncbi:Vacuolar protein sorting-associated protein 51-like protein [Drosera capensis]
MAMDDKAKRMRDLLASFYSTDHASSASDSSAASSRSVNVLDAINSTSFDPDQYMNLLVQKSNMETLLQRHVEMAAEVKNLDTDLQMLVYENYNKFISATETIKRMKNNIVGMEANMEQLLDKILSVQSRSDGVNTSLFEKREHIERLHRTRNLLRKVQFIYDLPERLGKCIKAEAYADAVRLYTGATPIFKVYGDSSFKDCKKASEDAVAQIIKNLQASGKLFSDSEPIQVRAESAMLLKKLDFLVDSLKEQLLEKLEQSLSDLQLHFNIVTVSSPKFEESAKQESFDLVPASPKVSTRDFVEAIRAYRPDLWLYSGLIWADVLLMDEVLPEASLPEFSLEAAVFAVKQYISITFSFLLQDISDSLLKIQRKQKDMATVENPLQVVLEASKKTVIQGCMGVLLDFRQLLDNSLGLLVKLRDPLIDWVQGGFQDFFRTLYERFLLLAGCNISNQDLASTEGSKGETIVAGLVLEIASSFSGGGVRGYEYGPAFVPVEICRLFRSAGEKFLQLYIRMKTHKVSVLFRKRFTTPNWIKHKEPREVHMFVDLFLQEVEGVAIEVKQILPEGAGRKHRHTESNGSTTSSRSNTFRDDKLSRSTTQRARSQLLETHLAKLFKQKMEIFTKVESTQVCPCSYSVVTTILKHCLKSLLEFVRLQNFNRSGFQQIQLDIQYLRTTMKDTTDDEAAVDFLLDEVIVAAAERSLDPIPLEPPILDRLIQAKFEKKSSAKGILHARSQDLRLLLSCGDALKSELAIAESLKSELAIVESLKTSEFVLSVLSQCKIDEHMQEDNHGLDTAAILPVRMRSDTISGRCWQFVWWLRLLAGVPCSCINFRRVFKLDFVHSLLQSEITVVFCKKGMGNAAE